MENRAFISYSHDADLRLALVLQSALRRIGKPWYRLPFRIFLDKMVMGPGLLPAQITNALTVSEFFILLASPESAASDWVTKEITVWLGLERRAVDHFIIVLTDGEIRWDDVAQDFDWTRTTALSTVMRGKFAQEPLYVDVRWARHEKTLSLKQTRFRDAVVDIGSVLHGVPRDVLDDQDVRRARQARLVATVAVAGLTALAIAAGNAWYVAKVARDVAICRQLANTSLNQLDQRLDLALLIAVEAVRMYESVCPDISSALLAAIHHQPRLVGFLSMPQTKESLEVGGVNVTTDVAFSPDGRMLAATSWHAAQLWDVATRRPLGAPLEARYGIAFTPDSKTLIGGDGSSSIHFWDTSTGREAGNPLAQSSIVTTLALSPGAKLLASGSESGRDGLVYLWDVSSRRRSGAPLPGFKHAFSPDGRTLATADEDLRGIVLWDVETRKPRRPRLEGHTEAIRALAFNPDGTLLASGGSDQVVIVWRLETMTPQRLPGHAAPVNDLEFSDDGRLLASAGGDGRVILWDAEKLRPIGASLAAASGPVFGVAFDKTGRLLASTSGDERVILWNLESDLPLGRSYSVPPVSSSNMAFSRNGRNVAFVDSFGSILLWDLAAGKSTERFGERVTALDFSADGSQLAAVSRDGVLSIWDVSTPQLFGSRFTLGDERFWSVRFSDDGKRIAIGGDSVLVVWDVATQKPIAPFRHDQRDRIWSLAFSADGRVLIAGGNESLRLWNLDGAWTAQDVPVASLAALSRSNVALSPDGALFAFRDGDRGVAMWDLPRREPVGQRLMRNRGLVSSLAFSPDGKILAVGGKDGTIVLWDVATGVALGRPLSGHDEDEVEAIAFGPDGRTLVSIGAQKLIVWDLRTEAWTQAGCRVANRNLTRDEWARNFATPYRPTCF